jgi:hypothetical protein
MIDLCGRSLVIHHDRMCAMQLCGLDGVVAET